MKKVVKGINIVVTLGLVCVAATVAFIALPIFGNSALIVRSGSMGPTIDVGSLVAVRPVHELISPTFNTTPAYKVGDIITFRSPVSPGASRGGEKNEKIIITHRIIGIETSKEGVFYRTMGDANEEADGWLVSEQNILGKVYFTLPQLGKLLAFAKSDIGFPILIILPAILVILLETYNIVREIRKHLRTQQNHSASSLIPSVELETNLSNQLPSLKLWADTLNKYNITGVKLIIPFFIMGIVLVPSTLALYADQEVSQGNVFHAAAEFPPQTDHLVISEVQINGGPGDADHDFIELYNPTDSPIDLNGHRLVVRTGNGSTDSSVKSWTTSTLVQPHKYYLWANGSDAGFVSSINPDTTTNFSITNSHSIALRQGAENTGTLIDSLSWTEGATIGEGTVFSPNPGADQGLERKALSTSTAVSMGIGGADEFKGNGFDSNNNAADFILRLLSQPQNSSDSAETP